MLNQQICMIDMTDQMRVTKCHSNSHQLTSPLSLPDTERFSPSDPAPGPGVALTAVMLEETSAKKFYDEDGVMYVYEKTSLQLFLVGEGLEKILRIKLTTSYNSYGGPCTGSDGHYQVNSGVQCRHDRITILFFRLNCSIWTSLALEPC